MNAFILGTSKTKNGKWAKDGKYIATINLILEETLFSLFHLQWFSLATSFSCFITHVLKKSTWLPYLSGDKRLRAGGNRDEPSCFFLQRTKVSGGLLIHYDAKAPAQLT